MKFKEKENYDLTPLERAIAGLEALNIQLGRSRNEYLIKESERKHFESKLVLEAMGKSHAEKVVRAQATERWLEFHRLLARKEAEYEFLKLQFQILEKSWQSLYLETKLDSSVIKKQD